MADRFHLIQNLRLAIEEQMSLSGRATGRALLPDEDIEIDQDDRALHEQAPGTRWPNQLRRAHRQSRKEVFETVHALSTEGLTCSEIARRTGYGRRSITKWLTFETPPDRRIGDAIHSGLAVLTRFARALRRDIDAVCNAIDLPWCNGQAEGQINRMKTIKRRNVRKGGTRASQGADDANQIDRSPHKLRKTPTRRKNDRWPGHLS